MNNKFGYIKNTVGGIVIFAVTVYSVFALRGVFSADNAPEKPGEHALQYAMYFFSALMIMLAVIGLFTAAQNLFLMYAEKTGLENHAAALKALDAVKAILILLVQLIFWSVFVVLGLIAACPSIFPFNIEVSGGAGIFGWIFIAVAGAVMVSSVIKTVKAIKRTNESYDFDKYALPQEYDDPRQSASNENEDEK